MDQSKLTNNKDVQVVALKLDKSKSRELAFRLFLDQNESRGINRKETILRMFEYISGESTIVDTLLPTYQETNPDIKTPSSNSNKDIETIKMNTNLVDSDDWDSI